MNVSHCEVLVAFLFSAVGDWDLPLSVAAQLIKRFSSCISLAQENPDVQGTVSIECVWLFLCYVKLNHGKSVYIHKCVHTRP